MKHEELRVGNLVQAKLTIRHKDTIQPVKYIVESIKSSIGVCEYYKGNIRSSRNTHFHIKDIEPIPLTELWLSRFGFVWIEKESYCNKKQWTLQVTGERAEDNTINRDETWFDGVGDYSWLPNSTKPKTMVVSTLCRGNYVCNSVKYVHQLQNLYFALTGQDLEYT